MPAASRMEPANGAAHLSIGARAEKQRELMADFHSYVYWKHIFKDAEVTLGHQFHSPFMPAIGMKLWFPFPEDCKYQNDEGFVAKVATIEWRLGNSSLWIHLERREHLDCPCKPGEDCCTWPGIYQEEFFLAGFKEVEVLRGKQRIHNLDGIFNPQETHEAFVTELLADPEGA